MRLFAGCPPAPFHEDASTLRRFVPRLLQGFFAVLCIFCLIGCNVAKTISIETLADTPAGVTTRFVFPTSGSYGEAYLTRPRGPGPFPLIILLHGHNLGSVGAKSVVVEAEAFASDLCYAGLAVSLPGFGATEVQPGMDPRITLNVVLGAISLINNLTWIDPNQLYLYGFSRGAFFTSLLANQIDGLRGIILHSGAYDLDRLYHETSSLWLRSLLNPTGEENSKLISILPEVSTWRAPTLVLHGEKDFLIPVKQATLLRDSLEIAKKHYRFVLYPNSGHRLPPEDVRVKVIAFLKENSGSACRPKAP